MTTTLNGNTILNAGTSIEAWSPSVLFAAGEQGAWYDPSDLNTMWQDSAQTTPVTGVEQSVGYILDKSGRGNHASQSTSGSRPTLSARVNLLTKTEQFNDTAWTKNNVSISADATTSPIGNSTADAMLEASGSFNGNARNVSQTFSALAAVTYIFSAYVKANGRDFVSFSLNTTSYSGGVYFEYNLATGVFTLATTTYGTGVTLVSSSAQAVGSDWYLMKISATFASSVTGRTQVGVSSTANFSSAYSGDITKGLYIWGADLRVSNDGVGIPPYQRVNTATDYDAAGFPYYLAFNGTSSALATAAISWNSTVMSAFAGVRVLGAGGGTAGRIFERDGVKLWAINQGSGTFYNRFLVNYSTTNLINDTALNSIVAPVTQVYSANWDGGANQSNVSQKINGVSSFSTGLNSAGSLVSDNNLPLYVGNRAAGDRALNGRIYSLVIRGASTTAGDIAQTEQWVNGKTFAY